MIRFDRQSGEERMKKRFTLATLALFVAIVPACAADDDVIDRTVDGVLGGLGGALIGGPIGLIAGAGVGASAGPAISKAWGLDRSSVAKRQKKRQKSQ
jgi:outer membrane lipoprotein SlyB